MKEMENKNDNSEQIIENNNNKKRIPTILKIENNFNLGNESSYFKYKPSYFHKNYYDYKEEKKKKEYLLGAIAFNNIFHLFLILILKTGNYYLIFPCVCIFICSFISSFLIFPYYLYSISTINVIDYLKKRINAKVFLSKKIPAKYVVDVTGKIDIPKNYNFVFVSKIQYFIDKSLSNFIDKYLNTVKDDDSDSLDKDDDEDVDEYEDKNEKKKKNDNQEYRYLNYSFIKGLYYRGDIFLEKPFISSNDFGEVFVIDKKFFYFAKYGSILFSILQIQWILTLILKLMKYSDNYIVIRPAKVFISENNYLNTNKTEINIHGKVIKQEDDNILKIFHKVIKNIRKKYNLKQKKLKEENRIKREIEKKKREELENIEKKKQIEEKKRKENTETLGLWENDNYKIYVYREYNTVYLKLTVWENYEVSLNKTIELGNYNPKIKKEEYEGDTNLTTVYIPKGYYIKIIVTNFEYRYNIKIGNGKFDKSFKYNQ